MFSKISLVALMALAALETVSALAITRQTTYPVFTPGPNLPSLASLNLTSAELYTMTPKLYTLDSDILRPSPLFDPICSELPTVPVEDVISMFNYLESIGGNSCEVDGDNETFCTDGDAQTAGSNISGSSSVASSCSDVAIAVQWIFTNCNNGGYVSGAQAANGNGGLIVSVGQIGS